MTHDMVAVARVASRVTIEEVRLAHIKAERLPEKPSRAGHLHADVDHLAKPTRIEGGFVEVNCAFKFVAYAGEQKVATVEFAFDLVYTVEGDAPVDEADAHAFASLNGPYNAWPFARQTLHDVTSKMGLPPYVLKPFIVLPPRPSPPEEWVTVERIEPPRQVRSRTTRKPKRA